MNPSHTCRKLLLRAAPLLAVCGLVVGLPVVAAASPNWGAPPGGQGPNHSVYVQTDDPSGNQILDYQIAPGGQLVGGQAYSTGGLGGVAAQSAVDPLASQDSVVLAEQNHVLLTVNAGSNTVSVFAVTGHGLVLSQVVPSGGQFPNSIAVHGNLVYVLNSGNNGSIQGYWLFGAQLVPLWGSNRSLGLGNTNPPIFLNAAGEVGFSPDGSQLIVTTKASGNDIDVFHVGWLGIVGPAPTVTVAAAPVPFAFTFDAAGHLVVAEAGASDLTSYSVNPSGTLNLIGTAGDGQAALCWLTLVNGQFYGSNAGSADVSQFSESASGAPQLVAGDAGATGAGATDSIASPDGHFLYVEEGGAGTVVEFQIGAGGSLTQIGELTGLHAPMEGIAGS
jgi:hypothetical protein